MTTRSARIRRSARSSWSTAALSRRLRDAIDADARALRSGTRTSTGALPTPDSPRPPDGPHPPDNDAVARAVRRLFLAAHDDEARSVAGMTDALARMRGRPIVVRVRDDLPEGVFGAWIRHPEHDEVAVATWVLVPDRTIAHELGHLALGHAPADALDLARAVLPARVHPLAELMLTATTEPPADGPRAVPHEHLETEAEHFASLLLHRIGVGRRSRGPHLRALLDEELS